MTTVKIVLIMLVTALLIGWVRQGHSHVATAFPLLTPKPAPYLIGGLVMSAIFLAGLSRMRRGQSPTQEPSEPEFDNDVDD